MFDLFDEVIGFDIMGGFDDEKERAELVKRAEELGINVNNFQTIDDLKQAIANLERE